MNYKLIITAVSAFALGLAVQGPACSDDASRLCPCPERRQGRSGLQKRIPTTRAEKPSPTTAANILLAAINKD